MDTVVQFRDLLPVSGFYAYMWLREDGTPYYVGKGQKDRAISSRGHGVHRPADKSRILIFARNSQAGAFDTEKELIRNWGRLCDGSGCLRNILIGGDQPPDCTGKRASSESKEKMSRNHQGVKRPDAAIQAREMWADPVMRARLCAKMAGRKVSVGARTAQSIRTKGQWADPVYREKQLNILAESRAYARAHPAEMLAKRIAKAKARQAGKGKGPNG